MGFRTQFVKGLGEIKFPSSMTKEEVDRAVRQADMSQAARMARAKAQGFDVDRVWYHGTTNEFDEFSPDFLGANTNAKDAKLGFYFAGRPQTAEAYLYDAIDINPTKFKERFGVSLDEAEKIKNSLENKLRSEAVNLSSFSEDLRLEREGKTELLKELKKYENIKRATNPFTYESNQPEMLQTTKLGRVLEVKLPQNMKKVDFGGQPWDEVRQYREATQARDEGFSGVIFENIQDSGWFGGQGVDDVALVFDPKNIRSTNAMFLDETKDSTSLLASAAPLAVGAGLAATQTEQAQAQEGPTMTPEQQAIVERVQARQAQAQPTQQAPTQQEQPQQPTIIGGRGARAAGDRQEVEQPAQPGPTAQQEIVDRVKARRLQVPEPTVQTRRGARPNPAYEAFIEDVAEGVGEFRAEDLPSYVVKEATARRLDNIPELAKVGIKSISDNTSAMASLAALTAFDPVEVGKILSTADPDVEMVMPSPDDVLLVNRKKGTVASVNQAGPSLMDALQFGGAAGLFTGVGVAATRIPGYAAQGTLGRAATLGLAEGAAQAGVEALQQSQGGDFNFGEVGLATLGGAAAPVLAEGARRLGPVLAARTRNFIQRFSPFRDLINPDDLLPTPAFQRELDRQGLVYGDIIQDIEALAARGADANPRDIAEQIAIKRIEEGDQSASIVGRRLVNGRPVADELAQEAVKQGFRPRQVQFMKTANQPTKNRMLQMLGLRRRMQIDESVPLEARPARVAGDEAFQRYKFIQGEARRLRNELNNIAKREFPENALPAPGQSTAPGLKQLDIDPQGIKNTYVRLLNELDISATRQPNGAINLDFGDSIISKNPGSRKIIKDITDLLLRPQGPEFNAAQFHKIKRQIDDLINWRKASNTGIPETGRRFAKEIRFEINQALREVSPEYARVNDKLSKAITALENFDDVMGRRFDPYKDRAAETVGQELRKLMSNYSVRNDMVDALENVDQVAAELGQTYDVDLNKLVNFNYALQERFGTEARTSLQGASETAARVERLATEGPVREGIRAGVEAIVGKLGPDEEKAFNALQRLLRRGE